MVSARRHITVCMTALLALASCKYIDQGNPPDPLYDPRKPEVVDKRQNLTREDYENLQRAAEDPNITFKNKGASDGGPPIPDLAPILAAPQPPKLGQTKLVSLTVTDDVPLKDVLLELARLADVDMEVDPGISGGVTLRTKDRPFNEVVERIAKFAGLRYKMENGVLRVERDTPYVEIYPIDFINMDRSSTGTVNINTSVLSSGNSGGGSSGSSSNSGGGGGSGLTSGATTSITSTSTSDFWAKFEEGIQQILAYRPGLVAAQTAPSAAGAAAAPAATGATSSTGASAGASSSAATEGSAYSLNRQGATLTVSATQRQHELIRQFLKKVETNTSAQVLIEAKIVEVTLNREFQSGINWSRLGGDKISFTTAFGSVTNTNLATFNFNQDDFLDNPGVDLDLAVRLAETFGTTRTLSSPRLHTTNNQQAVLTFAENQVFFRLTAEREQVTSTATTSTLTVNSELNTVPIGIIMTIQPSINLETGEVTLNVHPTLSRVTGFVSDPAVAYIVAQARAEGADLEIDSQVPIVEERSLETMLKLKSGQVMVIGGLMEDKSINTDNRLPYVSEVPVLGELFKGTDRTNDVKELVIFIRATIMDSKGGAQDADKAVYKKFTTDPRPLNF